MLSTPSKSSEGPGILFFNMPFASPASIRHGQKLIDCLAPICGNLYVVGDSRIDLRDQPEHVVRHGHIPTLHYVASLRPQLWSAIWWIFKLFWILARASWSLFELRRQVDVVICFQGNYYVPVLLCARLLGKKSVSFEPGTDAALAKSVYQDYLGGGLLVSAIGVMQHLCRKLADVCAIESLCLIEQNKLQPYLNKVRLGNLYINTDFYKATVPFEDRPIVVGFLGRLSPTKGIMELLEAAASMHGSGVLFQIVGDGPLRAELEVMCKRPEFSHVEYVGWANQDSVIERLNQFRLMVLPTEREGLPNVVLEAMACGTPVLATAVGGIPDLIEHNVTGFILPDRNPNTIGQSIRNALFHKDLSTVAKFGQTHILHNYSLNKSTLKWRNIISDILEKT